MTNRKTTRRALFMSVISLMLCCAMLVGTTFAWFTDEVTSVNNIIKAGNLDVELYYKNGANSSYAAVGSDPLFSSSLWEPGHVEMINLKVSNLGTLALKYQLNVSVINEKGGINKAGDDFLLSDYIRYAVLDGDGYATREAAVAAAGQGTAVNGLNWTKSNSILANGADQVVTLVVWMPETVTNEANYKTGTEAPQITLGINLYATQVENENDSFGDDYDEDAWVDGFDVYTEQDLNAAIANGETNIDLMGDIAVGEQILIPEGAKITMNLNGKTLSSATGTVIRNEGALTLVGKGTVESAGQAYAIRVQQGTMIIDSADINVKGAFGAVSIFNGADVTINGGSFKADGVAAMTSHTVYMGGYGTLNINGGSFYRAAGGDSGGVIVGYGWENDANEKAVININGGTIDSEAAWGWISNYDGAWTTIVATGGTFGRNPSAIVASGYKVVEVNGVYHVISSDVTLAYDAESLKAALTAGGKISVVNNIELNETALTVPAGVTAILSLEGNTISGSFENVSNANKTLIDVKGDLTVNGEGTITMKTTGINMGWNAMGCTICVNGGNLTVNDATIKNEGGTDMSFALDTNPWNPSSNEVLDVVLNNATIESTQYRGVRVRDNGPYLVKFVANDSKIDEIWYQEYSDGDNANKGNYGVLIEVHLNNTPADVSRVREPGVLFIDGVENIYVTSTETLQAAIDAASNGAVINLQAGEYTGTVKAKSNITIVGTEGAVVDCVSLNGASNLTLKNIEFDAAGAQMSYNGKSGSTQPANIISRGSGSAVAGGSNIVIEGCTFGGTFADGGVVIAFTDQGTAGYSNITVKGCTFEAIGGYADVYTYYSGNNGAFVIEGNTFASKYAMDVDNMLPIYLGKYQSAVPVVVKNNNFENKTSFETATLLQDHSSYGVSFDTAASTGNTFAS